MISYLPENVVERDGVRSTGFYSTQKWKRVRDQIKVRDKMTCQRCGKPITGRYIVDHKIELNFDNYKDWDVAYNPDNLWLLCQNCHNLKTFRKITTQDTLW